MWVRSPPRALWKSLDGWEFAAWGRSGSGRPCGVSGPVGPGLGPGLGAGSGDPNHRRRRGQSASLPVPPPAQSCAVTVG